MAGDKFLPLGRDKFLEEAIRQNVLMLTSQVGGPEVQAVTKKTIPLAALTGVNTDDIANIHATLTAVVNHLKG